MGYQMCLVAQKQVDGKWVEVEHLPRDDYEPEKINRCVVRDDHSGMRTTREERLHKRGIHGKLHQQLLIDWEEGSPICAPRGLPEDMVIPEEDPLYVELVLCQYGLTWFTTKELLEYDYDAKLINHWGAGMMPMREFVGQPFIDWVKHLQDDLGVERVVLSFG